MVFMYHFEAVSILVKNFIFILPLCFEHSCMHFKRILTSVSIHNEDIKELFREHERNKEYTAAIRPNKE